MVKKISEPVMELRARVKKADSLAKVAKELKCTSGYLSQILTGHRPISAKIADRLGYEMVWRKK